MLFKPEPNGVDAEEVVDKEKDEKETADDVPSR